MNIREWKRSNHTSANIEGSGKGKLGPENKVETTLSSGEFPPMNNKYFENGKKLS